MADSFTDGSCLLYNCTKRIGFPQMIYCKDGKSSVAVERPYVGDLLFAGEGSLSIGDLTTTKRVVFRAVKMHTNLFKVFPVALAFLNHVIKKTMRFKMTKK